MRRNSFHQAVRLSTLESAVCQGVWDILKCPCTLSTFPLLLGYKFPRFIASLFPLPPASVRPPVRSSHFLRRSESAKTSSLPTSPALTSVSLSLSPRSFGGRTRSLPPSFPSPHVRTPDSRLALTYLSLSLSRSLFHPARFAAASPTSVHRVRRRPSAADESAGRLPSRPTSPDGDWRAKRRGGIGSGIVPLPNTLRLEPARPDRRFSHRAPIPRRRRAASPRHSTAPLTSPVPLHTSLHITTSKKHACLGHSGLTHPTWAWPSHKIH